MKLTNGKYLGRNKKEWKADGISVSETEYHNKVYEGWHSHENMHMSFIIEGGNREQRKHTETAAVPGTLLFYAPGELHRNCNTLHPSRNINLEIEESFFSKYDTNITSASSLNSSWADAKFALLKIYRECLMADCSTETSAHLLLLNIFADRNNQQHKTAIPDWIKTVHAVLHDRWNENISLSELAFAAQVHPVTISKYFPRYFNGTFGEYIRKIRIEKSLQLVKSSRLSLTEIAYQCGFCDQSHFIHAFRELTGYLPGQYRKM
jgi:AraC family transcriptional regulator